MPSRGSLIYLTELNKSEKIIGCVNLCVLIHDWLSNPQYLRYFMIGCVNLCVCFLFFLVSYCLVVMQITGKCIQWKINITWENCSKNKCIYCLIRAREASRTIYRYPVWFWRISGRNRRGRLKEFFRVEKNGWRTMLYV